MDMVEMYDSMHTSYVLLNSGLYFRQPDIQADYNIKAIANEDNKGNNHTDMQMSLREEDLWVLATYSALNQNIDQQTKGRAVMKFLTNLCSQSSRFQYQFINKVRRFLIHHDNTSTQSPAIVQNARAAENTKKINWACGHFNGQHASIDKYLDMRGFYM